MDDASTVGALPYASRPDPFVAGYQRFPGLLAHPPRLLDTAHVLDELSLGQGSGIAKRRQPRDLVQHVSGRLRDGRGGLGWGRRANSGRLGRRRSWNRRRDAGRSDRNAVDDLDHLVEAGLVDDGTTTLCGMEDSALDADDGLPLGDSSSNLGLGPQSYFSLVSELGGLEQGDRDGKTSGVEADVTLDRNTSHLGARVPRELGELEIGERDRHLVQPGIAGTGPASSALPLDSLLLRAVQESQTGDDHQ